MCIYTHNWLLELCDLVRKWANRNSVRVQWSVIPIPIQCMLLNIGGLWQLVIPLMTLSVLLNVAIGATRCWRPILHLLLNDCSLLPGNLEQTPTYWNCNNCKVKFSGPTGNLRCTLVCDLMWLLKYRTCMILHKIMHIASWRHTNPQKWNVYNVGKVKPNTESVRGLNFATVSFYRHSSG
jgi:hypothetical protein